jgi:hypothetical protein
VDGGFAAVGQLVVPGGDGTITLEPADAAFDGVAGLVQLGVEGGRAPAARPLVRAVADPAARATAMGGPMR